ncbi:hypothetical protein [Actinomadura viridis]|uniref:Uncharacterized protein n=1 Tax=Actinomadura viridis TaxID=58110 RepID=A0A931GKK8_9ACTN|nr:hypothetical protein [Actinomadura viridis]MBG6090978.1 hypothetical protein [Actinomadura viridis]
MRLMKVFHGGEDRNALVHYRALGEVDGVEIRLHDTVLYNSI